MEVLVTRDMAIIHVTYTFREELPTTENAPCGSAAREAYRVRSVVAKPIQDAQYKAAGYWVN